MRIKAESGHWDEIRIKIKEVMLASRYDIRISRALRVFDITDGRVELQFRRIGIGQKRWRAHIVTYHKGRNPEKHDWYDFTHGEVLIYLRSLTLREDKRDDDPTTKELLDRLRLEYKRLGIG